MPLFKIQLYNPCIPPKALVFFVVPLPKGAPKLDLHQNVSNIIANIPAMLMVPGRSFWKSTF